MVAHQHQMVDHQQEMVTQQQKILQSQERFSEAQTLLMTLSHQLVSAHGEADKRQKSLEDIMKRLVEQQEKAQSDHSRLSNLIDKNHMDLNRKLNQVLERLRMRDEAGEG